MGRAAGSLAVPGLPWFLTKCRHDPCVTDYCECVKEPPPELAQLAAQYGDDGWVFRHDDDSSLWLAERPGAWLAADTPDGLADLLAELAGRGEGDGG
jgi:hypothetical protein